MRLVSKEKLKMAKLLVEKNGADLVEDSVLKNLKLGQLEDIEEELGIDLITLFKALKNGIYGKVGNKIEHILAPHLSWYYREIYIFKIKDYGKTWTLTKEELL